MFSSNLEKEKASTTSLTACDRAELPPPGVRAAHRLRVLANFLLQSEEDTSREGALGNNLLSTPKQPPATKGVLSATKSLFVSVITEQTSTPAQRS